MLILLHTGENTHLLSNAFIIGNNKTFLTIKPNPLYGSQGPGKYRRKLADTTIPVQIDEQDMNPQELEFFNGAIRKVWHKQQEEWYFSVIDVCQVLTDSVNPTAYWRKLKQRLKFEGNETVTICHGLKMESPDGKMRKTDCASTEQLLRIIQSIPSKKAEPFKQWLAHVGAERLEEMADPEKALDRGLEYYRQKGYPDKWIKL